MGKKRAKDSPDQMTFTVFCAPIVQSNGDGSFTVRSGKPITELSPVQLGKHFGVDCNTVYRWRQEGLIPDKLVRFAGKRKLRFNAEVISILEAKFKKLRE